MNSLYISFLKILQIYIIHSLNSTCNLCNIKKSFSWPLQVMAIHIFKHLQQYSTQSGSCLQRPKEHCHRPPVPSASLASLVIISSSSAEGCSPDLLPCMNRTPPCPPLLWCTVGVMGKRVPASNRTCNWDVNDDRNVYCGWRNLQAFYSFLITLGGNKHHPQGILCM
jgi:hypothetical protein